MKSNTVILPEMLENYIGSLIPSTKAEMRRRNEYKEWWVSPVVSTIILIVLTVLTIVLLGRKADYFILLTAIGLPVYWHYVIKKRDADERTWDSILAHVHRFDQAFKVKSSEIGYENTLNHVKHIIQSHIQALNGIAEHNQFTPAHKDSKYMKARETELRDILRPKFYLAKSFLGYDLDQGKGYAAFAWKSEVHRQIEGAFAGFL